AGAQLGDRRAEGVADRPAEAAAGCLLGHGRSSRRYFILSRLRENSNRRMQMFRFLCSIALALCAAAPALAADYPAHPLKWIVPYPPGGTTDLLARLFAPFISERLK